MLTTDERVIQIREESFLLGIEINKFLVEKETPRYLAIISLLSLIAFEIEGVSNGKQTEALMELARKILTARIEHEVKHGLIHNPEIN
jgi:urease gamma subunit